jgi:hypothetical protein
MLSHIIGKVALALILACFLFRGTQAQEVGVVLICDTQKQVEDVVALANQSKDINASIEKVNVEAGTTPSACGIGNLAYVKGDTVGTVQTPGGRHDIVKVMVVAVQTQLGFVHVIPPLEQFSLFKTKGEDV